MVRFECEVTSCCNEICSVASFSKSLCCENVKFCGNVATATIHVVWFQDSVWYPWWRGDHLSLQPARTADCQVSWSHAHLSRLPIYCGLYCMTQRGDKFFWNVCFWSLWANFWSMRWDSSTLSILDLSWVTYGVKIWCIADSTNSFFLACSRACASKVFSLRADCGRVIVYPGLKQWERPRHNIFGVCTRLAGGVCMSTSANSSASKHLTVTKIVWKIVYVTFNYLISHFFKILSLEFMANLFRDFRASVSLKVFHYRLRGKWCQYDLEIN